MATETSTKAGPGVDLTGTTDAGPTGAQAPSPSSSGGSPKFDAGAGGAQQVPNEWVVALQPFADPDEAEALARGFGGDAEERFRAVFEGFVFRGPEVAARRLAEHPRVRKVTANGVVEASADSNPTGVAASRPTRPGPPEPRGPASGWPSSTPASTSTTLT